MRRTATFLFLLFQLGILAFSYLRYEDTRVEIDLNEDWQSMAFDSLSSLEGFEQPDFKTDNWTQVNVPHNWDQYEGYRRLQHGNKHGFAGYRKHFTITDQGLTKRYFLFFEGVGSYATVFINGQMVGAHAGGRTTFTLDITDFIRFDEPNLLAVRADHPPFIQDLPWVCGGCSSEYGFSEGSQPFGIFRPVHLLVTDEVRVQPFGVHIWNDSTISESKADLNISTSVKNYGKSAANIDIVSELKDQDGISVISVKSTLKISAETEISIDQKLALTENIHLWSLENPYLYNLQTKVFKNGELVDVEETKYGIRKIKWDIGKNGTNQFYLNDRPVFINGTAEYEHNMGMSHAFQDEMIAARVSQIRAAGFNAFRDAHQPHHFGYHQAWDSLGVLWWTQMSAHVWYDTPEFRENFKTLLTEWVKERRNSPSVILWGLENESTLPEDFAKECTELIRKLDPTSPTQRLVTTCNGGSGTDWDVPQNWTGTYGGNPDLYHQDMARQQLIGEYGAWRTLDLHTEGPFIQNSPNSEDRMTLLMEKKIRLADSAKSQTCGHFQWIFTSHENPGRNQSGEAFREIDRVGPINYKGLLTPWGEPTDAYYMYRANFADHQKEPMVYLVSHTWPNRWSGSGLKDSIIVYSNCEEVELYNGATLLGKQRNPGIGQHFQWGQVNVQSNLLRAVGYVNGEKVAEDQLLMQNLPADPMILQQTKNAVELSSEADRNYLYRYNCGGPDYVDSHGNRWMADQAWSQKGTLGSENWTAAYDGMPAFFASQRRTFDPVDNTLDGDLFRTFRFGLGQLKFHFPLPDGHYQVELHFIEPWNGTGGGLDCKNWRNFDVAINDQLVIDNLDIWSQVGHDRALIKTVEVDVKGGELVVHFPEVKSGQAVISAIAISSSDKSLKPVKPAPKLIQSNVSSTQSWLDWGDQLWKDKGESVFELPSALFGADYLIWETKSPKEIQMSINRQADVYVAVRNQLPVAFADFDDTKAVVKTANHGRISTFKVYKKRIEAGSFYRWKTSKDQSVDDLLIFANAATEMAPPYDLKAKVPYDDDVAVLENGDLIKESKFGLGCVWFNSNESSTVYWPIKTGVADYHAIHFKYTNETNSAIHAQMILQAADGTVLQQSEVIFEPTKEGKYQEITAYTQSMINAGNYQIKIQASKARGLGIRGIRVQ